MARKIKLTDTRIGKLKARDVEYMVWDTRIAGFGVRVGRRGTKATSITATRKANPGSSRLGR